MPKYLIIRFSSIGDIVLTSPVVRCLKEQTDSEIHYLTKKAFRSLVDPNPYIDKVHVLKEDLPSLILELRREDFDGIIDLHGNLRSLRVKLGVGKPASTFRKLNLRKWLLVNFKINWLPDRHIVDRYLDTIDHLGVQNDGQGLDFFFPEAAETYKSRLLEKISGWVPDKPYIAVAIGAAHRTKQVPSGKMIAFLGSLSEPVVLLGGPSEEQEGMQMASKSGKHVINTCGRLSIAESAYLIREARLVFTPDTGMMHIAAAFGKTIVSVWGNTVQGFGMYPYYPKGIDRNTPLEVLGLSCRPCSKIGFPACPKGHFRCMEDIPIRQMVQAVRKDPED